MMAKYGPLKPADPEKVRRQWSGDSDAPGMEQRYRAAEQAGLAGVAGAWDKMRPAPTLDQVPLTPAERKRVGLGEK
jgi:hypothetical protein